MKPAESHLFAVPHAGLISVEGPDATAFLQAQLSRRVDVVTQDASALAGWHDARGRVRAVFRILVTASGYLLIGPAQLTQELLAALRMYVLRTRVTLDAAPLVCIGVAAFPDDSRAPSVPGAPPLPGAAATVASAGTMTAVCIAPGCWYLIGPADQPGLTAAAVGDAIAAAEIRNGLPQVDARTTARYVPQMLNLDLLGALDFDKGCYPGQEVIARTQHLGAVKRRACGFVCATHAAPDSETPIFDARRQRVGAVLRAAVEGDGRVVLLAVVALEVRDDPLHLREPDGPNLQRFTLPFE